jgi:peroxiredoxin
MSVGPAGPRVGDPAPELNLATEEGDPFDLPQVRGRPVLISFLSHAA